MKTTHVFAATLVAASMAAAFATSVAAQTPTSETGRNAVQQQRIENGLQSGQLTTHEAAGLERGEAHVDRLETRALKDGTLSDAEAAKIKSVQNKESAAIASQKHDTQTGNPASRSSRRMQADVQRNADQQARIAKGSASGTLSNTEIASLEHGQARVARTEANAAADGHVSAAGQARIQGREDVQSARVHHKKHN